MDDNVLAKKADRYAYAVYETTKKFPREEIFGITAQLRRAALSVPLNIIEGFARQNAPTYRQFLRISYASLKESLYLVDFSARLGYLAEKDQKMLQNYGDELGKMLWAATQTLSNRLRS